MKRRKIDNLEKWKEDRFLEIKKKSIKKKHLFKNNSLKCVKNDLTKYLKENWKPVPKVVNYTIDDLEEIFNTDVINTIGKAVSKKMAEQYGLSIKSFNFIANIHISDIEVH